MRIREERLRGALQVNLSSLRGLTDRREESLSVISLSLYHSLSFPFVKAVSMTTSRDGSGGLSTSVGPSWQSSRDALVRFHEVSLSFFHTTTTTGLDIIETSHIPTRVPLI
jgi:hypothetical protein